MLVEISAGLACASAVMAYGARGRSSRIFGPSVWRGPGNRRSVALTFDDGPSESTPELLELLGRLGVRATFFQCGVHARRLPEVARMVSAAGHEIGNHGNSHQMYCFRAARLIRQDLELAQEAIAAATGRRPTFFRAPYGVRWFGVRRAQRELGLLGVMWTAIGRDWRLPSPGITARLLAAARNGAIFCLHDGRGRLENPDIRETVGAVRALIPALERQGFSFETVSEILKP